MPKAKPKYINPVGAWSSPADITKEQREILTNICNDPEFITSVADTVGDYRADIELYKQIPNDSEELATMEDLQKSIRELERKLRMGLNWRAGAHLYKVCDDIDIARKRLRKIDIETTQALQKIGKPKAGRKNDGAKKAAARRFYALFTRHSIPWTFSVYDCRKSGKTIYSHAVKILSTFLNIAPESTRPYIELCQK